MLTPGRHASDESYRYGFQGQEKDDELKGEGNSVNYTLRMHDPRIGRFFAVDPLTPKYPHYTPYSFSGNKVVAYRELEGAEEIYYGDIQNDPAAGKSLFLMQSTDVGIDVIRKVWNTENTNKQRDVYYLLSSWSSTTNSGYTVSFKPTNIDSKGKLLKPTIIKDKLKVIYDLDLSRSKRKGNFVSIIVLNTNSKAYKDALNKNYLKLSETIYHEIIAHVVMSQINPFPNDEKSISQEHFRYSGWYSRYSLTIDQVLPDTNTPRQKYIDEAKKVLQNMKDLIEISVKETNKNNNDGKENSNDDTEG